MAMLSIHVLVLLAALVLTPNTTISTAVGAPFMDARPGTGRNARHRGRLRGIAPTMSMPGIATSATIVVPLDDAMHCDQCKQRCSHS